MITKENLIKHIENLPDTFSIDELIEKLIFIDKLENRILEANKIDILTEEQLKQEVEKC